MVSCILFEYKSLNLEFVHYSFLNYRLRCLEHTDRSCSDSLFTLQVSGELDTVSEAAQGVHALQNNQGPDL